MSLAGPGAVFAAFIQGLVCMYLLPYEWPWNISLLVGAILCATDPVSVVALLKDLTGASTSTVHIKYLITGEALLNDATALVLFQILTSPDLARSPTSIVLYLLQVVFVSPLVGCGFGLLTTIGLRLTNRRHSDSDQTAQIVMTICCAYLSFFVAQYTLSASGILSCCTAGFIIAWLSPTLILQPDSMEVIWRTLQWIANTLIFTLAGMTTSGYQRLVCLIE
jgi:NhaP-type Na+/H+ or K+/H+ antiporter